MKKEKAMKNIINYINKDLDKIDLYKAEKSQNVSDLNIGDDVIQRENSFVSFNSDTNTIKSGTSFNTIVSEPFNKEKDLDLPNFSPTKYISYKWRLAHSLSYFIYSILLLISSIFWIKNNYKDFNILMLIGHIFYCFSSFLQWFYYKRGCIGYANLNSKTKSNIDKSFKAKILRSEQGWKYFFSFFSSIILIYGNIYFLSYIKEPDPEFLNINFIGTMIISLAQILKLETILVQTKQYKVINDLSNALVETFMYFGSLMFGTTYFFQIMYNYDNETNSKLIYIILKISGNGLIILSGISLFNRYFFSDFDDLNVSDLSNVTL